MDFYTFSQALQSAECLRAQEMLELITVASFTKLKKNDQSRIHKDIYKKAYPDVFREKKKINISDLTSLLRSRNV
jgi:hypothetical protein